MSNKPFKIVIDAGHGAETPGKRAPDESLREFEFNREVAAYVQEKLLQYQGVETTFTHADDRDVPLMERTIAANNWCADLFLSIHANAYRDHWNDATGIETFVYKSLPATSVELANYVQNQLVQLTGRRDRGVKGANFHVLRETEMTSILVECEFMTNKESCELLKSDEYRQLCAEGIVNGIVKMYRLKLNNKSKFTDVSEQHWSYSEIQEVADLGIMNGFTDGAFKPSQTLTRSEMAVIASRIIHYINAIR
ncbi:N-acetylmuramoyl-L-alanine amidase [Chengkuizengella axinellae]|uniref:N-acetylmuramoyl-L-alanine amidase n=1 Tax=Chengkuizengella axinellae TaxID=3064388 RepID=A0ABT9J256_9BACL|nr:N-acetylmuramoyl-L-alanine amidase [Chengkuizengella sp. 2205SS18-9]MDP5275693.1 N-acetylmuramoyl-L-alanine amidase [Chengkuizengella sp. 2205SS18-9]